MKNYHKNPRQIKDKQFANLRAWLAELGDLSGIVHDLNTDEVISGNQRMRAIDIAKCEIVLTEGPHDPDAQGTVAHGYVLWQGAKYNYRQVRWTAEQCEKANIVANKAGGSWDFDILANEWEKDDLLEWGFELEELGMLPDDDAPDDPGAQIDKAEELREKWGVVAGQMWAIGEHRLMCGDCTDAAVVARVMGGEKARLVFTSPPYDDQREYELGKFDWLALANGMFDALPLGDPCDVVVNLGLSYKDGRVNQYWQPWLEHCEVKGLPLYGWYVWDKGSGFPGEWNGRLAPAHEWLFHFSVSRQSAQKWIETTGESAKRGASGKRFRQKDGSLRELTSPGKIGQPFKIPDSVVRVGREMARGIHTQSHPAVFPVELPEFAAQTWSDAGAIVFDPFLGSGTTMVAAHRLRRRCFGCEIDPGYAAVTLQRMSDMGLTPVLTGDNSHA